MKTQPSIKTVAVALALILGWSLQGAAQTSQYVTLTGSPSGWPGNSLPVQTNQIVSVVGCDWINKPIIKGTFQDGTIIYMAPYAGSTTPIGSQIPQIFTGLTNISVQGNNNSFPSGAATFQITTPANATAVSNYVPADAIVIPASATGNVQIILESSPDLVNWTAANPGTYGASAGTNRFFRVRAVAN